MPERHDVNETPSDRILREDEVAKVAEETALGVAQAAKNGWRRDLILLACLFSVLLLGAVYLVQISSIDSARATCERGNKSRVASLRLYNDLVGINEGRVEAAKESDDMPALEANRYGRRQYAKDRKDYVAAQADAALNPGGSGPNGVRVDCVEVNPYPWPL